MSFKWLEFLELARDLRGRSGTGYSTEAAERTAVSRAYYAAFCHFRNYAEVYLGFQACHNATDHERLRTHFQNLGQPWINVAATLGRLRKWRNDCDYDDYVPNLSKRVGSAIRVAERVLERLR